MESLPNFMKKRRSGLRIALASSGRFHLLDLARELDALGCDVAFYSYVPRRRAEEFGLPARCHVGLFPFVFPLVWLERVLPSVFPSLVERLMCWALDRLVMRRLRPCDIFVCMSGIYVGALDHARKRYGAEIVLHRGSTHILTQKEILAKLNGARQVTEFMIARELKGYDLADLITVPSSHVVESFLRSPQAFKVYKDPYGVDIARFPFVEGKREPTTVLYVGHWSYRKGVDVLSNAIRSLGDVRLWHVGAIVDAAFPTDQCLIHHDPVPQAQLSRYYRQVPVFVLASREEGLASVLPQALASGCLVVCTDRTGGADLAAMGSLGRLIRTVPADDAAALADAIRASLRQYVDSSFVPISQLEREQLSWRCYADREIQFMTGGEVGSATAADALHDHSEIR